jgi:peptidylprolyl isomerase
MSKPVIIFQTSAGEIHLQLMPEVAPKACENFTKLVEKGYYDGTVFHRVIQGFMLQGGDPTATGRGGESIWGKPFEDECTPQVTFNRKGLLAMANAGPRTNGSQFFITVAPTAWLNGHHTIFGEVIKGYEIVTAIENEPVNADDKPKKDQTILKAFVQKPVEA